MSGKEMVERGVHVPPAYHGASTSANDDPSSLSRPRSRQQPRPPLKVGGGELSRTRSHRERYDTDSQSTYGEHGSFAHGVQQGEASVRARSRSNAAPPGLGKEMSEYVREDVREKAAGEEVLGEAGRAGDLEKQMGGESDTLSSSIRQDSTDSGSDADRDPNLVTWDSPQSMENPRNWSLHKRWSVIVMCVPCGGAPSRQC